MKIFPNKIPRVETLRLIIMVFFRAERSSVSLKDSPVNASVLSKIFSPPSPRIYLLPWCTSMLVGAFDDTGWWRKWEVMSRKLLYCFCISSAEHSRQGFRTRHGEEVNSYLWSFPLIALLQHLAVDSYIGKICSKYEMKVESFRQLEGWTENSCQSLVELNSDRGEKQSKVAGKRNKSSNLEDFLKRLQRM